MQRTHEHNLDWIRSCDPRLTNPLRGSSARLAAKTNSSVFATSGERMQWIDKRARLRKPFRCVIQMLIPCQALAANEMGWIYCCSYCPHREAVFWALSGVTLLPLESVDMWDVLSVSSGHGFYGMKQRTSGELSDDRIKTTTWTEAQSEGCA